MSNYTPEQVSDIKEREAKALAILKELQLSPASQLAFENDGNDLFGIKLYPYLADTKYTISKKDVA